MNARRAALAALAAILIWLGIDGALHANHAGRVSAALSRHEIGLATAAQEQALTAQIGRWLSIAGVKSAFAVDQPPRRGRLNIYFTSPAALAATGVGYGNAAFDPSLDAIYIDRFFVDASPYQSICAATAASVVAGCREHMPSQQVMLAFVFFHELGHRQLHGVGSSAFASRPNDPRLRQMEAEADHYSLAQLKKAYAAGQPVVADPDHALAEALGFGSEGDPAITPAFQVWVDVFGALSVSIAMNGFLPAPYSPFYHDLAHPSLFDRTDGLIDVALADNSLPKAAADQFRFFRQILAQEERIPDAPFVEVTVPDPVSNVAFTDAGLAILTDPQGAIYTAADSALRPNRPGLAPMVVTARLAVPSVRPSSPLDPGTNELFWGYGGSDLAVAGAGGTWRIVNRRSIPAQFPLPTNLCFHWWMAPNPSPFGLAATCPGGQQRLSVASPDKVLSSVPVADLERAVRDQLGDQSLELELLKSGDRLPAVSVVGRQAFVPILARGSGVPKYRGVLTLSLPTLAVQSVALINLPSDLGDQQPARAVLVGTDGDHKPIILVVGGGGGLKALHWGVWSVGTAGRVEPLTQRPFLLATTLQSLSLSSISDFEPYLVEVQDLGPGWVLVNLSNEGVFLVDLRHRMSRLLYGYGGTAFHVVASHKGKVALFAPGGGKVFVFSLTDDT